MAPVLWPPAEVFLVYVRQTLAALTDTLEQWLSAKFEYLCVELKTVPVCLVMRGRPFTLGVAGVRVCTPYLPVGAPFWFGCTCLGPVVLFHK